MRGVHWENFRVTWRGNYILHSAPSPWKCSLRLFRSCAKSLIENMSRYLQSNSATPNVEVLVKICEHCIRRFCPLCWIFWNRLQQLPIISLLIHQEVFIVFVFRELYCENKLKEALIGHLPPNGFKNFAEGRI